MLSSLGLPLIALAAVVSLLVTLRVALDLEQ